ncbi:MAG: carbohydrate kinase family protein [Boseongicola sp.]
MSELTIFAIGELLVEFASHREGCALAELSDFSGPYPSGAPAICIDQAARMGAQTALYGGLGEDNFGKVLMDRLQSDGVDTNGIQRVPNKTTAVAFVSYFKDGSRTFIFHIDNTAADAFEPGRIRVPAEPTILHVSGASLGNAKMREAIERAVSEVAASGGRVSCDPNARPELMSDPQTRAALFNIMAKSTYLFPSTSDLDFLFPDKSEDEAVRELLGHGAEIVALKRGEEGCVVFTGSQRFSLSGHAVDEVDPTGAGDCFCGTFLAMLAKGRTPRDAGICANAAGAIAVTRRGAMEGNSSPREIDQFISAQSSTASAQAI